MAHTAILGDMSRTPARPSQLCRGPFRGTEAIAAGFLTQAQLKGRAWRRLFPDVYVDPRLADQPLVQIRGAALWLPAGAVLTGRAAARVWGVELVDPDCVVEVLSPRRIRPQPGLKIRVGPFDPDETTSHRGVRLTRPLHTAWEIARSRPEQEAIAWIDMLARRMYLTPSELLRHATRHVGAMGSRRAFTTLVQADPRAESPMESVLRLSLVRAGLPAPVPQFEVFDGGVFVARVDLAWPDRRVAVEYDGQWHADPSQLHRDRVRLRALARAGWLVYSVTREDLRDLARITRDIRALLGRRP